MPLIDPVTMSSPTGPPPTSTYPSSIKPKSTSASQTISLLPGDFPRIISQLHPALLLSAYTFRFPALVADPVPTLLNSLLPLALVQSAYAVTCLPAYGSEKKGKKVKFQLKKTLPETAGNKVSTIFVSLILTLLTTPLILALQILLGAPLTSHLPETLLSSAHFALLAIFPLIYIHGVEGAKWRSVLSLEMPVDEVFGAAVGCMVGAWLGAVPIPLDWDREWQRWPVTVVSGAYGGYVIGKTLGGWVLRGKRIALD